MIGVIAKGTEKEAATEFFELLKTPWEFYEEGREYDVVIVTAHDVSDIRSRLVIFYSSEVTLFDLEKNIDTEFQTTTSILEYHQKYLPIYGKLLTFSNKSKPIIRVLKTGQAAGIQINGKEQKSLRVGFDLFQEIDYLLSAGQPPEYAHIPALEIHISMLRNWILQCGIPFIEVPPVPVGYDFIACLTHDVDFVRILDHKFDQTMVGFIYRALFGSFMRLLKGRISWGKLIRNWKAVLLLPGVYFGLLRDYWSQFKRYIEVERGLGSTFFIIPFKNDPGQNPLGPQSKRRSVQYNIADLKSEMQSLNSEECEIALHGINSWLDPQKAIQELSRISSIKNKSNVGVRIHWLYFSDKSPKVLEEAGFLYDSTFGYNETVGYKAGTTQLFRPLGLRRMLEVPLHITDTALFYPKRMALSEEAALRICKNIIDEFCLYGGVLVINWHQRSLAPERLWGDFYFRLLAELKARKVWFAICEKVVHWFNVRRSIIFTDVVLDNDRISLKLQSSKEVKHLFPDLIIRFHKPKLSGSSEDIQCHTDVPLAGRSEIAINF